jgi:hypothetical protein
MAAPAHAAHTTLDYSGSVTSGAMPIPSGVVAGSTCVVAFGLEWSATAPTSFAPPASGGTWTHVSTLDQTGGDFTRQYIYEYRAAGSESGTWTFTWTNNAFHTGSAHRITGAASAGSIFDAGFDHEVAASNQTDAPTTQLTTLGDERLVVWFVLGIGGDAVWTPPSGFTEVFEQTNLSAAWIVQAAAGSTGALTGSNGTADRKIAFLGAVNAGAPVDPGAVPIVVESPRLLS